MNDEDDFRETPMLWYYEYEHQCNAMQSSVYMSSVCTSLCLLESTLTNLSFHFDFAPTFFNFWNVHTLDSVISLFHEISLPILWKFVLSSRKELKRIVFLQHKIFFTFKNVDTWFGDFFDFFFCGNFFHIWWNFLSWRKKWKKKMFL